MTRLPPYRLDQAYSDDPLLAPVHMPPAGTSGGRSTAWDARCGTEPEYGSAVVSHTTRDAGRVVLALEVVDGVTCVPVWRCGPPISTRCCPRPTRSNRVLE